MMLNMEVEKAIKKTKEFYENEIIKFLKENGFRPKNNIEYFKSLNKRLKKSGLILKIEYEEPVWITDITNKVTAKVKMGCRVSLEKVGGSK